MLSTFLSQIQSYFSKYFIVGSFLPVLAFAAFNGIIGNFLFGEWKRWVAANLLNSTVGQGAFFTASFVVAIIIGAYVLSSLSTFLRQKLEGKGWGKLAGRFIPTQNRRRERLIEDIQSAAMDVIDLEDAPQWEQMMREAQTIGRRDHRGAPCQMSALAAIESKIGSLEDKRGKYHAVVGADELRQIADDLAVWLRTCDVDHSPDLARQQERLGKLIDLRPGTCSRPIRSYAKRVQFQFRDPGASPDENG
jgi:hypothetical protein